MKHYLTETEQATLRHVLGLHPTKIEAFEELNLDDKTRQFIIFEMMFASYEKGKKVMEQSVKEETKNRKK